MASRYENLDRVIREQAAYYGLSPAAFAAASREMAAIQEMVELEQQGA